MGKLDGLGCDRIKSRGSNWECLPRSLKLLRGQVGLPHENCKFPRGSSLGTRENRTSLRRFRHREIPSPPEFSRTTERILREGSVGVLQQILEGMSTGTVLGDKQPFGTPMEIPREILMEFPLKKTFSVGYYLSKSVGSF